MERERPLDDLEKLMLQRSPSRRAGWQRNWRRRVRDGAKLAEVPGSMVELLVSKWLKPHESDNKRAISEALDAFARDAIKNRYRPQPTKPLGSKSFLRPLPARINAGWTGITNLILKKLGRGRPSVVPTILIAHRMTAVEGRPDLPHTLRK